MKRVVKPGLLRLAFDGTHNTLSRTLRLATMVALLTTCILLLARAQVLSLLANETARLTGGDAIVESFAPLDNAVLDTVSQLDLSTSEVITFFSVVDNGDQFQLAQIIGIDSAFPLKGNISFTEPPEQGLNETTLWVDTDLQAVLRVSIGEQLQLGGQSYTIGGIVDEMPLSGSQFTGLSPRVVVPIEVLKQSRLLTPASRATYQLVVAGNSEAINELFAKAQSFPDTVKVEKVSDRNEWVRQSFSQLNQFLLLALVMVLAVSSVTLMLFDQLLRRPITHQVALAKVLGASRWSLLNFVSAPLFIVLCQGVALGLLLTLGLYQVFLFFKPSLPIALPDIGIQAVGFACVWSVGIVLGSILCLLSPTLLSAIKTPPTAVFRQQNTHDSVALSYLLALVWVALLLWVLSDNRSLLAQLAIIAALLVVSVQAVVKCLIFGLSKCPLSSTTQWMLKRIQATPYYFTLLMVLATTIMVTAFSVSGIQESLSKAWIAQVKPDAPNLFFVNVPQSSLPTLNRLFEDPAIKASPIYPVQRAQLTQLNGNPIKVNRAGRPNSNNGYFRPLNLTWSDKIPLDNTVVSGTPWSLVQAPYEASLEVNFAKSIQAKVGDRLTFVVGATTFEATVVQLREVTWQALTPNFYVIFKTDTQPKEVAYLASAFVPETLHSKVYQETRAIPGLSIINVAAILNLVKQLITVTLVGINAYGVLLLLSVLMLVKIAGQYQKALWRREFALYQVFGIDKQTCKTLIRNEMRLIFVCALLLSTALSTLLVSGIAEGIFEVPAQIPYKAIVFCTLGFALLLKFWQSQSIADSLSKSPTLILRASQ